MKKLGHRLVLVFIGVPCLMVLLVLDAVGGALDEFKSDWRSLWHWFVSEWTGRE